MPEVKEVLLRVVENTKSNIDFYNKQISYWETLKKKKPELEEAFEGDTYSDLIEYNKNKKYELQTKLQKLQNKLNEL